VNATSKPFLALTANDLMSRNVAIVPRAMSLRTAAHLLVETHISGAPVVDDRGECVGVLSSTDFMHSVGHGERNAPIRIYPDPACFHSPWQVGEAETLPTGEVSDYMTDDPVTVSPSTSITELARMMTDAHIHRVIVVDAKNRPIGIVSSTDILAAVAYAGRRRP
jgi:predicted transcriptional regulator